MDEQLFFQLTDSIGRPPISQLWKVVHLQLGNIKDFKIVIVNWKYDYGNHLEVEKQLEIITREIVIISTTSSSFKILKRVALVWQSARRPAAVYWVAPREGPLRAWEEICWEMLRAVEGLLRAWEGRDWLSRRDGGCNEKGFDGRWWLPWCLQWPS